MKNCILVLRNRIDNSLTKIKLSPQVSKEYEIYQMCYDDKIITIGNLTEHGIIDALKIL